jgi:hypothetical protein
VTTAAHLVHRAQGRVRLRIPERRHDASWLADLEDRLRDLPGITEVSANPRTAGVLVLFDPAAVPDPIPRIEATGLLQVVAPPPLSPTLAGLRRVAARLDDSLGERSGGSVDLRTLSVISLLVLALYQAMRGRLLAPAVSLLWYAFELLRFMPPDADAPGASDTTHPR